MPYNVNLKAAMYPISVGMKVFTPAWDRDSTSNGRTGLGKYTYRNQLKTLPPFADKLRNARRPKAEVIATAI